MKKLPEWLIVVGLLALMCVMAYAQELPDSYVDAQGIIHQHGCCHRMKIPTEREYTLNPALLPEYGTKAYIIIMMRDFKWSFWAATTPLEKGPRPRDFAKEPKGRLK